MIYLLVILIQFFSFYLLSRIILSLVSSIILLISRRKQVLVYGIWALFLPGTIIHEASHVVSAFLLRVGVFEINFSPRFEANKIKLASVSVEKTDILRRTIVGASPFFVGISLIYLLIFYFINLSESLWSSVFMVFFVFQIANTMFSSKKDMEGSWGILISLLILSIFFYLSGFKIPLEFSIDDHLNTLRSVVFYNNIVLIVDMVFAVLFRIIKLFLRR